MRTVLNWFLSWRVLAWCQDRLSRLPEPGLRFRELVCPGLLMAVAALVALPSSALGAAWRVEATASPSEFASAQLSGVSCVSEAFCEAVGHASSSAGATSGEALAEVWNGAAWSEQPLAQAPDNDPELSAVSCVSATFCVAVGGTATYPARSSTLVEMWNGMAWTTEPTPNLGRGSNRLGSSLSGVSCRSPTFCVAVGSLGEGDAAGSIAEIWNGRRWRLQTTPRFPSVRNVGPDPAELSGVSCVAANACTAVGYYFVHYLIYVPLVERWNGQRWVVQPAPNENSNRSILGGVQDTGLTQVSCTTRSSCIAIGGLDLNNGIPLKDQPPPFAERWNGVRWSVVWAGSPRGGGFSSVSCVSPTHCTGVGAAFHSLPGSAQPLAEIWNGTRWAVETTEGHPHGATLDGVSCVSSALCTAVGSGATDSSNDDTAAVAESTAASTPTAVS